MVALVEDELEDVVLVERVLELGAEVVWGCVDGAAVGPVFVAGVAVVRSFHGCDENDCMSCTASKRSLFCTPSIGRMSFNMLLIPSRLLPVADCRALAKLLIC